MLCQPTKYYVRQHAFDTQSSTRSPSKSNSKGCTETRMATGFGMAQLLAESRTSLVLVWQQVAQAPFPGDVFKTTHELSTHTRRNAATDQCCKITPGPLSLLPHVPDASGLRWNRTSLTHRLSTFIHVSVIRWDSRWAPYLQIKSLTGNWGWVRASLEPPAELDIQCPQPCQTQVRT